LIQNGFDLPWLDPIPADLDLIIQSTEKLDIPTGSVTS